MHAELDALVCSGALRSKQQTYALLSERAPHAGRLRREEALAELTRRFFTGHGPATLKDYRWWSGLTAADAQCGLDMVRSGLRQFVVGDRSYWFAGEFPTSVPPSPTAHLLQGYDEYFSGYSESRELADVAGLAKTILPNLQSSSHALIIDGQLAGRWRRSTAKGSAEPEFQLLRPLAGEDWAALERASERYSRFVGLPSTVKLDRALDDTLQVG